MCVCVCLRLRACVRALVCVHVQESVVLVYMYIREGVQVKTGPRSAVGNVSGYRCVADCNSRGREFDPGPVPYFRGD